GLIGRCFGDSVSGVAKGGGPAAAYRACRRFARTPMRLLLLGSLLVLLSVASWGALQWSVLFAPASPEPPAPPIFLFVSFGRDANAAHADAVAWQTSTGREDCTEVVDRRRRDEGRRLAALISSANDSTANGEDEGACAPFQLGEVERGVKVQIVGECGR